MGYWAINTKEKYTPWIVALQTHLSSAVKVFFHSQFLPFHFWFYLRINEKTQVLNFILQQNLGVQILFHINSLKKYELHKFFFQRNKDKKYRDPKEKMDRYRFREDMTLVQHQTNQLGELKDPKLRSWLVRMCKRSTKTKTKTFLFPL